MSGELEIVLSPVYGFANCRNRSRKSGERRRKKYRVYESEGKKRRFVGKFDEDEMAKSGIVESGVYGKIVEEDVDVKKVLVCDTDLGLEHALGIGRCGYDVYYSVIHSNAYPKMKDEISGYGFPGIHKIWDWGEGLEKGCGVVVFTDIGFGKVADFLRRKGYYVFGSDSRSERLETDRIFMRKTMMKLGIDVPKGKVISGVDRLLRFIDNHDERYFIKVNFVRGDFETMSTDDKKELLVALSKGAFTILGDEVKFVVEEPCDGIEIGVDFFFNGDEILSPIFETVEYKGMGNITKVVDIEDSVWRDVLSRISSYLSKNGYRGMVGVEGFYDGEKIRVIDWSMRFPYICSYAYPYLIENYGDVIVSVAMGENVEIKTVGRYSCQIGVYTDVSSEWRIIRFEKGKWKYAFRKAIIKDGDVWYVPGDSVVAVSIGVEDNLNDAIDVAVEGANKVEFPESYNQGDRIKNRISQFFEKAEKYGYIF